MIFKKTGVEKVGGCWIKGRHNIREKLRKGCVLFLPEGSVVALLRHGVLTQVRDLDVRVLLSCFEQNRSM